MSKKKKIIYSIGGIATTGITTTNIYEIIKGESNEKETKMSEEKQNKKIEELDKKIKKLEIKVNLNKNIIKQFISQIEILLNNIKDETTIKIVKSMLTMLKGMLNTIEEAE